MAVVNAGRACYKSGFTPWLRKVRRAARRRHSQAVRQRFAKPSSPVQIRVPPPSFWWHEGLQRGHDGFANGFARCCLPRTASGPWVSSPVHGVDGSSPGGLERGCRLQLYDFGPENSALYSAFLEALPSDLAQLVAAWPTLSEQVRWGILAMVEAMRQRPDTPAVQGAVQS